MWDPHINLKFVKSPLVQQYQPYSSSMLSYIRKTLQNHRTKTNIYTRIFYIYNIEKLGVFVCKENWYSIHEFSYIIYNQKTFSVMFDDDDGKNV